MRSQVNHKTQPFWVKAFWLVPNEIQYMITFSGGAADQMNDEVPLEPKDVTPDPFGEQNRSNKNKSRSETKADPPIRSKL